MVEKRGGEGAVARIRRMCGAWCGGGAIGPEQAREAAEVGAGASESGHESCDVGILA